MVSMYSSRAMASMAAAITHVVYLLLLLLPTTTTTTTITTTASSTYCCYCYYLCCSYYCNHILHDYCNYYPHTSVASDGHPCRVRCLSLGYLLLASSCCVRWMYPRCRSGCSESYHYYTAFYNSRCTKTATYTFQNLIVSDGLIC